MTPYIRPAGPHDLEGLLKLYAYLNPADTPLPTDVAETRFRECWSSPA